MQVSQHQETWQTWIALTCQGGFFSCMSSFSSASLFVWPVMCSLQRSCVISHVVMKMHSISEWWHGDILGDKLWNGKTPIKSEGLFIGNKCSMRHLVYDSSGAWSCHHFICQFPMIYQITLFLHSNKTVTWWKNLRSRSICFRFYRQKRMKLMKKIRWEFGTTPSLFSCIEYDTNVSVQCSVPLTLLPNGSLGSTKRMT